MQAHYQGRAQRCCQEQRSKGKKIEALLKPPGARNRIRALLGGRDALLNAKWQPGYGGTMVVFNGIIKTVGKDKGKAIPDSWPNRVWPGKAKSCYQAGAGMISDSSVWVMEVLRRIARIGGEAQTFL